METTSETNNWEKALQHKIDDLTSNYNDFQLKQLLKEHGLEKMPFAIHTKKMLIKKLAQKIVDQNPDAVDSFESGSAHDKAAAPTLSSMNIMEVKLPPPPKQVPLTDADDLRKNLVEARESLTSCLSDSNKTHYAVCIPGSVNTITVESDFREVLKMMKEHKSQNPRMLSFPSLAEAQAFVNNHTANEVCEGATIKSNYPQEKAVEVGEVKLFPSPTPPQINEFRIQLERGNINFARERMLSNPRFLIGNGDMPTILKEGPRYNAMHASVTANQLESCRLVMEMVSDVEYLKKMYGTQRKAEENSRRLIDLYLNTPDKIAHKTPLHFASEKGMVDIVAFLVSFKACIRNFNRHITVTVKQGDKQIETSSCTGKTPEEVACSRYNGPNEASVKAKIITLIQGGTCYVPLIRSDTTGPYAKVGDPYTPTTPYKLVTEIEDVYRPTTAVDPNLDIKDFRNMKVWAYAGPMSPQEAEDFKKEWKSPRLKRRDRSIQENLKVMDSERGFEHFGRELAEVHATSWQEYWPFLDAFADLRSEEGLEKLELFFQKQRVLIIMQALLKKQDFVSAPPYHVSPEFILQNEGDDSGAENDNFFSAESQSCSEEEEEETAPEASTSTTEDGTDTEPSSKSSGGVFSSLWGGFTKLKNYLSPSSNKVRRDQNVSNSADSADSKVEQNRSGNSNNNDPKESVSAKSDPQKELGTKDGTNKLKPGSDEKRTADNPEKKTSDQPQELNRPADADDLKSSQLNVSGLCKVAQDVVGPSSNQPEDSPSDTSQSSSSPSSSVLLSSTGSGDAKTASLNSENSLDSDVSESQSTNSSISQDEGLLSGCAPVVASPRGMNISQSPDQWKYRRSAACVESPGQGSLGSESESDSCPTSPSLDIGIGASPVSLGGTTVNMRGGLQQGECREQKLCISAKQSSDPQLDDSFNTKMDTICESLEKFAMLSPPSSFAVSNSNTGTSSGQDDFTSVVEPSIQIFTGSTFCKFFAELHSRKLTSADCSKADSETALPTVVLRQAKDQEMVMADVYLMEKEGEENVLLKARGPILDEETHREATKNVWVSFLAAFPTPFDAKRFCSLSRDETVRAVVEGVPEDRGAFGTTSSGKADHSSLKELFFKCKDSEASKTSVTLDVRIVRASTMPCKDVYVCGTIPTKVDADVYHTLNNKACQLVQSQADRFPLVSQWLDHMDRPGKDFINSLPSPSRVLRSERRELPPISPLVKNEKPTTSKSLHVPSITSSPLTSKGSRQEDPIVRTLFRPEDCENDE